MEYIIILCVIVYLYFKLKTQITNKEKKYNKNLYSLQKQIDKLNKKD